MKQLIDYILLGLLQGATEFLPVSSSGHLVAAKKLLNMAPEGLLLEVCLHFGTLLAVLYVFRKDIRNLVTDAAAGVRLLLRGTAREEIARRAPLFSMAVAIVIGSVPVAIVGACFYGAIKDLFQANLRVSGALIAVTGAILFADKYAPPGAVAAVGWLRALLIGVAQAVAVLPGISRSGATIVTGHFLGLHRELAARFSFLLAAPAMAGAMAVELLRSLAAEGGVPGPTGSEIAGLICGTAAAALVGGVCLTWLLRVIHRGRLHWFAAYCLPMGALLVTLSFFV